jgi:hypothetical protein
VARTPSAGFPSQAPHVARRAFIRTASSEDRVVLNI